MYCISDRKADMQDASCLLLSTHRYSNIMYLKVGQVRSGQVGSGSWGQHVQDFMMQDRTCKKGDYALRHYLSPVLRERASI